MTPLPNQQRHEKDAMYDSIAVVAKALGSGRRAEIVDLLAQGERPVEHIAHEIGQSVANTSHHLQVLARAGLVTSRRDGVRIMYRLASGGVFDVWDAVRDQALSNLADVRECIRAYVGDREEHDAITAEELAHLMRHEGVVVVDVRPEAEFDAGHIPGARSIPVDELKGRLHSLPNDLPKDREIVAYCRGPYCVFSDDAVRTLRRNGYHARRLSIGYPEWRRYTSSPGLGHDGQTTDLSRSHEGTSS